MDKELKALLAQTITIHPYKLTNKYNEHEYNSSATEYCRIEKNNKVITNSNGDNVLSNCQIFVDGSVNIDYRSKIVLPDGTEPGIIAIQDEPDEHGISYYKCIYT